MRTKTKINYLQYIKKKTLTVIQNTPFESISIFEVHLDSLRQRRRRTHPIVAVPPTLQQSEVVAAVVAAVVVG